MSWQRLRAWVRYLPEDRQYRLTWVKAAELRSYKRSFQAIEQYDNALKQAQNSGFRHDAALIAEHAASLCESLGHTRMANDFRLEALSLYQSWGAWAKVAHLSQLNTKLLSASQQLALQQIDERRPHTSREDHLSQLDLETIVNAAETLAQESDQQALLQSLMHLVMEHAGAERGLLLLRRQDAWKLVAQIANSNAEAELLNTPIMLDNHTGPLCTAMVRYTILTHDPIVLADASQEGPFVRDPYVLEAQPRSVLCFPILLHNHLIGLMYLENNLVAGVFTQKRQTLLSLLTTHAAISLQLLQKLSSKEMVPPSLEDISHNSLLPHPTPYPRPGIAQTLNEPLLQIPNSMSSSSSPGQDISLVSDEVGDWKILRKIAEGGMSFIYEAYNKYAGQRAALKLLLPNLQGQALRNRRFEREARLLEQFSHPNIISLLDFDTDPRYGSFMALEYLEGETLQAVLERHAPVPLGWLLAVSEQLCDALAVVHQKGIIHRDLKPSNIFLSPDDLFPRVRLLDFGIADVSQISKDTRLTSTGVIVGTPAYLAPEQLKEKSTLTTATDLYAFGVIWFEALTGKHPMGEGGSVELFVKILQGNPTRLGDLRPEFQDTELEMILSQLFTKDPTQRPNDIELLWNELSTSCQFIEDPSDTPDRYPTINKS